MKKLHELLKKPLVKGDVGIEIECEGASLFPHDSPIWGTEDDGSLRGKFPTSRCEWVAKKPIEIGEVEGALKELFAVQEENKAVFNFSFRTSVHIHINVGNLTKDQVMAMAYAYYLIEDVMLEYCAEHRRNNRFCLKLSSAEGAIPYIRSMVACRDVDLRHTNPENNIRYSSLNLEALWKYGSLEFRALEGTADVNRILVWTQALYNIREYASSLVDIRDVHDQLLEKGPRKFLENILGDVVQWFKCEGYTRRIETAFSLTIELPYSYVERVEIVKEEPVVRVEDVDVNPILEAAI